MFFTAIASTFTPILFGKIAKSLGASANPAIYGYLIAAFGIVGYWGSIPFWYLAGKSYEEEMTKRQESAVLI